MKWFLISLAVVVCSLTIVRGDAAGDLYAQGIDALNAEQYDVAAKDFEQILTGYPNTPNIDDVRLRAGFAHLHTGDFTAAIASLAKEAAPSAKPEYRGTALYFTGLAQFSQGQKATDKAAVKAAMGQAAATFTTLIQYITTSPNPDNRDYMEDAIYYRALANYQAELYPATEKDLLQLIQQPPFNVSLKKPDYLLLLGSLYAVETNLTVTAKQTPEEIKAMAQKALDTFAQVSNDPNALVQANDANMSSAEVLYLIAQLDAPKTDGYQAALDAFRKVRRKDDMVDLQQTRLNQLKKNSQAQLQNGGASLANANSRLIDREEGRLEELKAGPDPIIQALLRMAECYVSMKEPDEARTVLRRLIAHATLTPEQQDEVDLQLLFSYAQGGQTDQADKALTDYLAKHPGDPQVDSISYQTAAKLMDKKDYNGVITETDRSLKDFPSGRYVSQVHTLRAQAFKNLNQLDKATVELALVANDTGPDAGQNQLIAAQTLAAQGDLDKALATYQKVKDNPAAGDLQAYGAAGYINTLQALQRYDDVITEANAFATKYPTNKALAGVLVYEGLAMDQKHDSGAIAELQNVAKQFPKDDSAPYALFYVVTIQQRAGNLPGMVQAYTDLRTAYPTAYPFLQQAADAISDADVKAKKFDDAIALYQALIAATKPDVAADANNKVGAIWLAAAKAMGYYQSGNQETRAESQKRLAAAEQAFLVPLKNFPDQLDAVGDAFQGLVDDMKQRRAWGLLADADMEAFLGKLTGALTAPEMQARVELAKAGLVFVYKKGAAQYPAALDRFKKTIGANPSLALTRQESNEYGELLTAAQDYATAITVYTTMLTNAAKNDQQTQGDALYGLGAAYLAQGDVKSAADNFTKMKALPGGAAWHPHIQDANYGLALAAEQAGDPDGLAKQTYATMMKSSASGIVLQAKAMLGYGRLLAKAGLVTKANPTDTENAIDYYQQVDTLFGPATPEVSAEGLFDAGQAYATAGDKVNAQAMYKKLTDPASPYAMSASDWVAKAQAASTQLGQ